MTVAEALADVETLTEDYHAFPTLTGSDANGSPPNGSTAETIDIMDAAVSVEVIQSFTLIHDDIMDDDDLRRGVPAVHREYDLETAILAAADALIEALAEDLEERLDEPDWAQFAKTGVDRELPPEQDDFWAVRAASLLRKVADRGPIGVGRLATEYGGGKPAVCFSSKKAMSSCCIFSKESTRTVCITLWAKRFAVTP